MFEVFAVKRSSRSSIECLHVQSISHWAPACIGPYSQSTTVGPSKKNAPAYGTHRLERLSIQVGPFLLLAGQIGLEPASMALVSSASRAPVALLPCNGHDVVSLASRSKWLAAQRSIPGEASASPELQQLLAEMRQSLESLGNVIASSTKPSLHATDHDDDDGDDDEAHGSIVCLHECTLYYTSTVAAYLAHMQSLFFAWLSQKRQRQYCVCPVRIRALPCVYEMPIPIPMLLLRATTAPTGAGLVRPSAVAASRCVCRGACAGGGACQTRVQWYAMVGLLPVSHCRVDLLLLLTMAIIMQ